MVSVSLTAQHGVLRCGAGIAYSSTWGAKVSVFLTAQHRGVKV